MAREHGEVGEEEMAEVRQDKRTVIVLEYILMAGKVGVPVESFRDSCEQRLA